MNLIKLFYIDTWYYYSFCFKLNSERKALKAVTYATEGMTKIAIVAINKAIRVRKSKIKRQNQRSNCTLFSYTRYSSLFIFLTLSVFQRLSANATVPAFMLRLLHTYIMNPLVCLNKLSLEIEKNNNNTKCCCVP